MLLLFLLLPLLVTVAEYAEPPKGGNGGGVPPMGSHGGPPEKTTAESPQPSAGYSECPKPSKGGIKKQAGGSEYSDGPAKSDDGPKKTDAYAEAPEPQEMARAHRVQDQSPICPANAYFNICPPPRTCEPSCRNYYPTCVWNFCYRPRCTCYPGYYRRSGAPNAPCVRWQQCWRWGGPRWRPRPPRPGRPGPRVPWRWWMAG